MSLIMFITAVLAQAASDLAANPVQALYIYGPMGVMLAWFMWMAQKVVSALKQDFGELHTEIKTLSHRIDGMTRAMLMDVISRDGSGVYAKKAANEMLAKIDARDSLK